MNTIILNGQNSNQITGLLIQELPPISKPMMRTEMETIDGRDGDITTKLGYSAYDKTITIGLHGNYDINKIIAYFNSEGTVVFSNEPDKYYKYQILEQIDFERLVRYRTATVKLHCQPFKYAENEGVEILGDYNLLSFPAYSATTNGVTIIASGDNIHIMGTATANTTFMMPITPLTLPEGSYTLDAYADGIGVSSVIMRLIKTSATDANSFAGSSVDLQNDQIVSLHQTHTSSKSYDYLWFSMASGSQVDFVVGVEVEDDFGQVASGEGTRIELADTTETTLAEFGMKGNTSQETISGANLYNCFDSTTVSGGASVDADGWITITYDNSAGTSVVYQNYWTNNLVLSANTGYTVAFEVKNVSGTGSVNPVSFSGSSGQFSQSMGYDFSALSAGTKKVLVRTTKSSLDGVSSGLRTYATFGAGQSGSITFRLSVLADTTVTEDTFNYVKYVGGTESPNPLYPQAIQKVTGLQSFLINGKNLLNPFIRYAAGSTQTLTGVSVSFANDSTITLNGTMSGGSNVELFGGGTYLHIPIDTNKTYYLLVKVISGNVRRGSGEIAYECRYNGGSSVDYRSTIYSGQTQVIQLNTANTEYLTRLRFYNYYTSDPARTTVFDQWKVQLAIYESSSTDFEPYEEQKHTINLGKNLFDKDHPNSIDGQVMDDLSFDTTTGKTIWIPCEPNTTYTISKVKSGTRSRAGSSKEKITSSTSFSKYVFEATVIADNRYKATITTGEQDKYLYYTYDVTENQTIVDSIQIEKGSTATALASYFSPIELCKLGTYQDRIYKSGNKWYLEKKIGKLVPTGTEGWYASSSAIKCTWAALGVTNISLNYKNDASDIGETAYCPIMTQRRFGVLTNGTKQGFAFMTSFDPFSNTTNAFYIRYVDTLDTVSKVKTYLQQNPTPFYYVLGEAVTTEITNETVLTGLNAMASSHAYEDRTYITASTSSSDLPAIMNVTAMKRGAETVINSGNYISRPVITIYGSGDISLSIGHSQIFQIALGSEGHITIDGAAMEAYKDTKNNLKNRLVTGDYSNFVLQPGSNTIRFSGNVERAVIEHYSRWL